MARDLVVYLRGEMAGVLRQEDSGRLRFTYSNDWLKGPEPQPLSFSLPLREESFDDRATRSFFAGLLPDDLARERLARFLGVSRHNDFALLAEVGGECAGAITIVPTDVQPSLEGIGNRTLLNEAELAALLRNLPKRPLHAGGELRLSLAGAQDKMALIYSGGEFFLPQGSLPTTHILKPSIEQFSNTVPNEYFCIRLAGRIGLQVPTVEIGTAEDLPFLLIERYDRVRDQDSHIKRLHQEDFCQALAIPPERKYQGEGGPSLAQCFGLLNRCARPALDRLELLRRILFNYLIGNADAHGKNFALLYKKNGVALAPAYDLLCTTVYPNFTNRMAMKVGGKRGFTEVYPRHWQRFARESGLAPARVRQDLLSMAKRLPTEALRLADELTPSFDEPMLQMVDLIIQDLRTRTNHVLDSFGGT